MGTRSLHERPEPADTIASTHGRWRGGGRLGVTVRHQRKRHGPARGLPGKHAVGLGPFGRPHVSPEHPRRATGIGALVTELLGTSPQFAQMWQEHEVATKQPIVKRVDHPLTGPLEFECRVLHIPESGQRLIVYCAAPGSPTQAAFRRLGQPATTAVPL